MLIIYIYIYFFFLLLDFQKLEREARICRKLHHPNIGMQRVYKYNLLTYSLKIRFSEDV